MAKKFEDMTPEEKREAFDKWQKAISVADKEPVEYMLGEIEDALTEYLSPGLVDEAMQDVKEAIENALIQIDETAAKRE